MNQFLQPVAEKISQVMWALILNGAILVILAALITWNVFIMQLLIGLMVLVIAGSFFYAAHKLYLIKKILKKL